MARPILMMPLNTRAQREVEDNALSRVAYEAEKIVLVPGLTRPEVELMLDMPDDTARVAKKQEVYMAKKLLRRGLLEGTRITTMTKRGRAVEGPTLYHCSALGIEVCQTFARLGWLQGWRGLDMKVAWRVAGLRTLPAGGFS